MYVYMYARMYVCICTSLLEHLIKIFKIFINYENIDHKIENCSFKNVESKKLWCLYPEIASKFFHSNVPVEVKIKKVDVHKYSDYSNGISIKMYIVSIQNANSMNNKHIYDIINSSWIELFER